MPHFALSNVKGLFLILTFCGSVKEVSGQTVWWTSHGTKVVNPANSAPESWKQMGTDTERWVAWMIGRIELSCRKRIKDFSLSVKWKQRGAMIALCEYGGVIQREKKRNYFSLIIILAKEKMCINSQWINLGRKSEGSFRKSVVFNSLTVEFFVLSTPLYSKDRTSYIYERD